MRLDDAAPGGLTAEQIAARLGKLTASRMADAMSFLKNGGESKDRKDYKIQLVGERMTDEIADHYVTPAMAWGIANESGAKLAYARAFPSAKIWPAGFYDHPRIEYCGATPDALVDSDGLLECKCPTTKTYLEWKLAGEVPEKHRPQMALQLLCTGRKWCDFIAYDPRMPERHQAFIRRFTPTQEYLDEVEAAAMQFLKEVDALFERATS